MRIKKKVSLMEAFNRVREKPGLLLCLATERQITVTQFIFIVMSAVLASHGKIFASFWFFVAGMAVDTLLDYLHVRLHKKDAEENAKEMKEALKKYADELRKSKEAMDKQFKEIMERHKANKAARLNPEGVGANNDSNNKAETEQ
jgi:hypothetical protein